MGILEEFDPTRDGWSFDNWQETTDFGWDLYRRTYLAINRTDDVVEAPLDVAFFQIFKSCAAAGNCGGLCMLAPALHKYGGYMGFCSPPSFYAAGASGPARPDLHQAINIMQGRQFSAPGIRNFLDMANAGQLNDGVAAWNRIRSGLASGDYCILSLANSAFGEAAHTVIPYRAEMSGGTYVLHVWDPDRPYPLYPRHYDEDHNRIDIPGSTAWQYDQNAVYSDGVTYTGSGSGGAWCFAIPTFLEMHKAPQPISAGLALTSLVTVFVSGLGAAVTQIEDDAGRRLYTSDRLHRSRADLETSPARRLPGAPWPWPGGRGGDLPGELFFLERPPGSAPLNVSVRGDEYHLMHLSSDRLTEVVAGRAAGAKDRIRLDHSFGEDQSVVVSTAASRRRFDIHQLRHDAPGMWRSIRVHSELSRQDRLRIHAPAGFGVVDISGTTGRRDLDIEFRRYAGGKLTQRTLAQQVPAGRALRMAPADWGRLSRTEVEQVFIKS